MMDMAEISNIVNFKLIIIFASLDVKKPKGEQFKPKERESNKQ